MFPGDQPRWGLFWVSSTSKLWLLSSTPWAATLLNILSSIDKILQNFQNGSLRIKYKMIRQKIAAYIFSTIKKKLLQCQCYSVASRFEVFKCYSVASRFEVFKCYSVVSRFEVFNDSTSYLYPVVAKFDNCSFYVH